MFYKAKKKANRPAAVSVTKILKDQATVAPLMKSYRKDSSVHTHTQMAGQHVPEGGQMSDPQLDTMARSVTLNPFFQASCY